MVAGPCRLKWGRRLSGIPPRRRGFLSCRRYRATAEHPTVSPTRFARYAAAPRHVANPFWQPGIHAILGGLVGLKCLRLRKCFVFCLNG